MHLRAHVVVGFVLQNPGLSLSFCVDEKQSTHCQRHSPLFLGLFELRLLFISSNFLNIVPSIWMVRLVVGDVELAHRGQGSID